jgi:hypothetical protein
MPIALYITAQAAINTVAISMISGGFIVYI